MRITARAAILLAAATLVLTACGGDSEDDSPMSAEEYRTTLNAACADTQEELTDLSADVASGDVPEDEAQDHADEITADFDDAIESLDPPDELADAHGELLDYPAEAPSAEDPEALTEYLTGVADIYADLGADECEGNLRESAESVEGTAPTG